MSNWLVFFGFFLNMFVCRTAQSRSSAPKPVLHNKVLIFIFSQKGLPFSPVYSPDEI